MMQQHSALRTYTLAEFAVEQRLLRREKLFNRLREEKLEALKLKVSKLLHRHSLKLRFAAYKTQIVLLFGAIKHGPSVLSS